MLWRVDRTREKIDLVETETNIECNTPHHTDDGVMYFFQSRVEAVDHLNQYLESEISRLRWVLDSHKKLKLQISQEGNSEKMD